MDREAYQDYVADGNESVEFKFVRRAQDVESDDNFKPEMSHQIFGDTEAIFGYEGLAIKLYYTPGWLRTYFATEYKRKLDPKDIIVAVDDVPDIIKKFLDHDYYESLPEFLESLKLEPKFQPFGEKINAFQMEDKEGHEKAYEVYYISGECRNKEFFEYYKRLQNFIMWYIDGASFIDLDDEKWQYFIMYEKYKHQEQGLDAYAVVGFATVYEYYAFPRNIRPRIGQLLILPPFRKQGLAAYLLSSIYKHYTPNDSVLDITVEDPSVELQRVRDFVDISRCDFLSCLTADELKKGFTKNMAKEFRSRFKINEKQARRIYEILLLGSIDRSDEEEMRNYRIKVKRRINAQYERSKRLSLKDSEDSRKFRIDMLDKEYKDIVQQYYEVIERLQINPLKLDG